MPRRDWRLLIYRLRFRASPMRESGFISTRLVPHFLPYRHYWSESLLSVIAFTRRRRHHFTPPSRAPASGEQCHLLAALMMIIEDALMIR